MRIGAMAFSWRSTAFMPCARNCDEGGSRGGKGGKGGPLCPEMGCRGLQVCCASSMGTGYWRVHAYRRLSPISSCTTSNPTLGSTELPKIFGVLRLDKDVLLEESSGGPLSSSERAVEKAMKVSRAAENCRLSNPISSERTYQAECEKVETETGEGARGSRHMAGARVNGLWCADASEYGRVGSAVLNSDNKYPLLLRRREVSKDVEASNREEVGCPRENISFSRIGGGDVISIEDIDDNHYQDARAALSKIASKDDFLPSVKVEDMPAKGQCAAFDPGQHYLSVTQDPEKRVDDRHFNRCIHHLLAVLSLPVVTTIDKEPICGGPEPMVGSRGVKMSLESSMDDENKGVVSMTNDKRFYLHKPFLHLWDGFWIGPDDEDGWGFVEAVVSPVDIDGSFCQIYQYNCEASAVRSSRYATSLHSIGQQPLRSLVSVASELTKSWFL